MKGILKHNKCKGNVVINLNKTVQFFGIPAFSNGGVSIEATVIKQKDKTVSFYCTDCDKDIPSEELVCNCGVCKDYQPLFKEDGSPNFFVAPYGGMVCGKCVKDNNLENCRSIKSLILKD